MLTWEYQEPAGIICMVHAAMPAGINESPASMVTSVSGGAWGGDAVCRAIEASWQLRLPSCVPRDLLLRSIVLRCQIRWIDQQQSVQSTHAAQLSCSSI